MLNVINKEMTLDMLEKAIDADLLIKNVAKQINTKVSKEDFVSEN